MQERPLRVCYFGTYRAEYSRNQIMIEGLRRAGAQVTECHVPLWRSIEDRVEAASGKWLRPAFLFRVLQVYLKLVRRYQQTGDYDVMVVGYPGQFDVYLARLLTWLRRKPLVWDIFMSIYLIALERGLDKRSPLTIWMIRQAEQWACRLPDRLIIDTAEYRQWLCQTHSLDPDRFRLVPTGADDRIFRPGEPTPAKDGLFRVLYYGTFIPNHGVEYIIEAARLLRNEQTIQFELIGQGPERDKAVSLANQYGLTNVIFVDWLDKPELLKRIEQADVCLGAFGVTPQSLMTVQNKIYEGLAMRKAVITGDGPAVRNALMHEEHVYLCDRAAPCSLAKAINTLRNNQELRHHLAINGHMYYQQHFTVKQLGTLFQQHLLELV